MRRRESRPAASAMAEEREGGPSEKVLKLFGVSILRGEGGGREEATTVAVAVEEDEEEVMRKSSSMGNLASCTAEPSAADHGAGDQGYHSDGGLLQSGSGRRRRCQERKRGVPWTEEEHRTFLAGLEKLGKGDWRGISRKFVMTRTPTQVASHAQKYFLRQNNPGKKKRRSSLFDVVIKDKITPTEAAPMLSSTTNSGVEEDISHVNQDNKSVNRLAFVTTFVQSLGGGASSNFQHVANHSDITILPSPSAMVANSENRVNDQAITNYWVEPPLNIPGQMDMLPRTKISCTPDFLGLTLSYSSCQTQSSVTTPTTETSDLELRIAPPQPHSLSKLSSSGTADAIRVI